MLHRHVVADVLYRYIIKHSQQRHTEAHFVAHWPTGSRNIRLRHYHNVSFRMRLPDQERTKSVLNIKLHK